mmetsp:Transcript_46212/g.116372  ORF Transcript_46212/g.116372 Transcript_46212/m.116372 type:complete len:948 (-) Transcript_46212:409-3252(-)
MEKKIFGNAALNVKATFLGSKSMVEDIMTSWLEVCGKGEYPKRFVIEWTLLMVDTATGRDMSFSALDLADADLKERSSSIQQSDLVVLALDPKMESSDDSVKLFKNWAGKKTTLLVLVVLENDKDEEKAPTGESVSVSNAHLVIPMIPKQMDELAYNMGCMLTVYLNCLDEGFKALSKDAKFTLENVKKDRVCPYKAKQKANVFEAGQHKDGKSNKVAVDKKTKGGDKDIDLKMSLFGRVGPRHTALLRSWLGSTPNVKSRSGGVPERLKVMVHFFTQRRLDVHVLDFADADLKAKENSAKCVGSNIVILTVDEDTDAGEDFVQKFSTWEGQPALLVVLVLENEKAKGKSEKNKATVEFASNANMVIQLNPRDPDEVSEAMKSILSVYMDYYLTGFKGWSKKVKVSVDKPAVGVLPFPLTVQESKLKGRRASPFNPTLVDLPQEKDSPGLLGQDKGDKPKKPKATTMAELPKGKTGSHAGPNTPSPTLRPPSVKGSKLKLSLIGPSKTGKTAITAAWLGKVYDVPYCSTLLDEHWTCVQDMEQNHLVDVQVQDFGGDVEYFQDLAKDLCDPVPSDVLILVVRPDQDVTKHDAVQLFRKWDAKKTFKVVLGTDVTEDTVDKKDKKAKKKKALNEYARDANFFCKVNINTEGEVKFTMQLIVDMYLDWIDKGRRRTSRLLNRQDDLNVKMSLIGPSQSGKTAMTSTWLGTHYSKDDRTILDEYDVRRTDSKYNRLVNIKLQDFGGGDQFKGIQGEMDDADLIVLLVRPDKDYTKHETAQLFRDWKSRKPTFRVVLENEWDPTSQDFKNSSPVVTQNVYCQDANLFVKIGNVRYKDDVDLAMCQILSAYLDWVEKNNSKKRGLQQRGLEPYCSSNGIQGRRGVATLKAPGGLAVAVRVDVDGGVCSKLLRRIFGTPRLYLEEEMSHHFLSPKMARPGRTYIVHVSPLCSN